MKKVIALALSFIMILSMAACGTGGGETSNPPSTSTEEGANTSAPSGSGSPVNLSFAAGEVGTGPYTLAAAIQSVMLRSLPEGSTIDLTVNSPGAVAGPVVIQNGDTDILVGCAAPAMWSHDRSADEYEFGGCPDVVSLGGGLGHTFTTILFTQEFVDKTGYTTIEEVIADKYPIKLITKKEGTLGYIAAQCVIEACGITVEEFLSFATWEKTGTDAIKSGIQDGLYDCTIDHVDAGQATTTEICLTKDIHFVQMADETLSNMEKAGFAPIVMEAGTWNGQDEDIQSMGSQQCILVNANMSEDVAYAMTKAICENKEELVTAVASLSHFDPQTAGTHGLNGAPLHPGAARYYQEIGAPVD